MEQGCGTYGVGEKLSLLRDWRTLGYAAPAVAAQVAGTAWDSGWQCERNLSGLHLVACRVCTSYVLIAFWETQLCVRLWVFERGEPSSVGS